MAWKETGAWLNTVPVLYLGFRMEDKVLRIAEGLRVGAHLVQPLCVAIEVNRLMLRTHMA